jgi:hypothetical protein
MTQPAAFRATYSDWKLVKTRGVVQVILEVPLADSDAAYEVLGGMPDPSKERWFGVAAISQEPAPKKTPIDWRDVQPAAQAGIRCGEPRFREFLRCEHGFDAKDTDEAATVVRQLCQVNTRAAFSTNPAARARWTHLDNQYRAWAHL